MMKKYILYGTVIILLPALFSCGMGNKKNAHPDDSVAISLLEKKIQKDYDSPEDVKLTILEWGEYEEGDEYWPVKISMSLSHIPKYSGSSNRVNMERVHVYYIAKRDSEPGGLGLEEHWWFKQKPKIPQ